MTVSDVTPLDCVIGTLIVAAALALLGGGIDIAFHLWRERRRARDVDYDRAAAWAELNPAGKG